MLSKIKLCFATGALSLIGLVMSYGVCEMGKVIEEHDAFIKPYESEVACLLKIMIDHHRQHGITEDNKRKLLAAVGKLMGEGEREEGLLEMTKVFAEGLVIKAAPSMIGKLMGLETTYIPFEESGNYPELLKRCNEFEQQSYEAALNRYLEIADMSYRECERLTQLANKKAEL